MRSEILKAATKLFAAHGFDGTSLKDIADVVGIRKPSLLYHFASKDKLRLAVLQQLLQRWHEVLPKLLLATAGGEPRFDVVIQETISFFTADPDRARLLLREILDRPDDMRERLSQHVRPWVTIVADYIRKGQRHGEVHDSVDAEAYVMHVINLVVSGLAVSASLSGALLPSQSERGTPSERHVHELIRIAHRSLFRAPQTPDAAIAAAAHRAGPFSTGREPNTSNVQPPARAEETP